VAPSRIEPVTACGVSVCRGWANSSTYAQARVVRLLRRGWPSGSSSPTSPGADRIVSRQLLCSDLPAAGFLSRQNPARGARTAATRSAVAAPASRDCSAHVPATVCQRRPYLFQNQDAVHGALGVSTASVAVSPAAGVHKSRAHASAISNDIMYTEPCTYLCTYYGRTKTVNSQSERTI
jgi:hypothetical protein